VPYTNDVISVTSVQGLTVITPCKRDAIRFSSISDIVYAELIDNILGLEVPDANNGTRGTTEPVAVGRECKSINNATTLHKGIQVTRVVKIPEHNGTFLTTRSTERAIRRYSYTVNITLVTNAVGAKLAVLEVPDLNEAIPTCRDNDRVAGIGREANLANPLGVTLICDGVLALTKGVPELDGLVARTRNNLAVIAGEGNRENILLVIDKAAGGFTGFEVPETESVVPRTGKGKLTIRRDHNITHEVGMSLKTTERITVLAFLAGNAPDEKSLIARS